MTPRSQRHRTTTLPFRYLDAGLTFDIDAFSIDGSKVRDLSLKAGQREVDLTTELETAEDGAPEWEQVTLYGTLTVPEETIQHVFPESERSSPPGRLYIATRCHETIYRNKMETNEAFDGPAVYDVFVRLPVDRVRGTVELHPYLVRTDDGEEFGAYASTKNVRLASGESYSLVIDKPEDEEPPSIDGEEVSFSQEPHLPDGHKLYYLDFRNESRPKLWINGDHPRITDVLQTKGSVGSEPRMRDVILDQISYGVWTQLLIRAATAIDRDGEVEYAWQKTVIETFAPNLYDTNDPNEAAHKLREEIDDSEGLPRLVSRLDSELQEYLDPRTQLINLMEEGLQI